MDEPTKPDLAAVAVAPVAPGELKDVKTVTVMVGTAVCYREHKFPAGDPRQACHIGLKKLDFAICPNCIWFGKGAKESKKLLTGAEAMVIAGTLATIRQTHDPMSGARAEPVEVLLPQPEAGDAA